MSEIPERIEREMFEIRSRMAPDVRDLRKHVEPQVVGKRVGETVKERLKVAVTRAGKSLIDSAKRQARLAGEVGRKRDPSELTDAVKSDPRPLALLAIGLTLTLFVVRRATNGRGDG